MNLTNIKLQNFIKRIKLKETNMPKYREQISNLIESLETKIKEDVRTGAKVGRVLIAGSWKKRTILRPTGDNPIDIDLVFFIEGDDSLEGDIEKLHDFIVEYLSSIYPMKDIKRDVDAEGKTKSVKIKFTGTGLEVDIVPVIPISNPKDYVWQPERGGGGKYITSVDGQLNFAKQLKDNNSNFTAIVRALKWWKNHNELNDYMKSFSIELIVSYLEREKGVENNIEEGIIRFFEYVSSLKLNEISFNEAINDIPAYHSPIFIGDPMNNENNITKKLLESEWEEVISEANEAFETLNIAQSCTAETRTIEEWKKIFGPSFNIDKED